MGKSPEPAELSGADVRKTEVGLHEMPAGRSGASRREIERFDELAEQWWDPQGPMRPLHRFNPIRLAYIRDQICARLDRDARAPRPLSGLTVLDVGCGAGLLSEPLSRLGARVTGIDPAPRMIEAARLHARHADLAIDYETAELEAMLEDEGRRWDVVIASEVIEHSADPEGFMASMSDVLRPSGVGIVTTLNRTLRSFTRAIVGAEYVLGWLPRGTHDWRRFIRPSELAAMARRHDLRVADVTGVAYDLSRDRFRLSHDRSVNYFMTFIRGQH